MDDRDRACPAAVRARWAWAATCLNGVGNGVFGVTVAVLVAQRFGIAAAGLAVAGTTAGRLCALAVTRRVERCAAAPEQQAAAYRWLVSVMVVLSLAGLGLAAFGPYWSLLLVGAAGTAANSAASAVLVSQAKGELMRLGPAGMAGQAAGAVAAGAALSVGGALAAAAIALVVVGQALQIPALDRHGWAQVPCPGRAGSALIGPAVRAGLLAGVCFGPLILYAPLVGQVASVAWVGPAMIAYAAGALAAPALERRLRCCRDWPSPLLLGAVGTATWVFAVSGPMVLAGRLIAGAVLFTAQGRLYKRIMADHPGPAVLSAAGVGVGLGSAGSSALTGWLAARLGVPGAGAALTVLALLVWSAARVPARRRS